MTIFGQAIVDLRNLDLSRPTRLTVDGINLWVAKQGECFRVYYDECAHMGGGLKTSSKGLVCKVHGWTYDDSGKNLNQPSPNLREIKILSQSNEELVLSLPKRTTIEKVNANENVNAEITVLSHASIQFHYNESRIVFDPWLLGRAYYGAWQLYPDARIHPKSLKPSAIVISHPHPDHFHLETLEAFDKSTPIYFPRFPSKIIENGLRRSKFTNVNPMYWGQEFCINKDITIEFLKPRSFWEDSATLLSIQEEGERIFTWLNLVDAGSVIDEFLLPRIDLLSSAFNQGASGYPLTWEHIGIERKRKMMKVAKANTRRLLIDRAMQLNPRYFLPFAGHWRLALQEHQNYAQTIEHTSFDEIVSDFSERVSQIKVLGVYPGETFKFSSEEIVENRSVRNQVMAKFESLCTIKDVLASESKVNKFEFRKEMAKLTKKSEAFGVENVFFEVAASDSVYSDSFHFVSSRTRASEPIFISVKLPTGIINLFAKGEANFDHIAIGYWGEWNRKPDIYPSNFMRLLQTGTSSGMDSNSDITDYELQVLLNTSVGNLIERNVEETQRILTRMGLPCLSCVRSNSETLQQALEIHQIRYDQVSWLLRELMSTVKSVSD